MLGCRAKNVERQHLSLRRKVVTYKGSVQPIKTVIFSLLVKYDVCCLSSHALVVLRTVVSHAIGSQNACGVHINQAACGVDKHHAPGCCLGYKITHAISVTNIS